MSRSILLCFLVLGLAACGGSSAKSASTTSSSAPRSSSSSSSRSSSSRSSSTGSSGPVAREADGRFHVCELVTPEELSAIVGQEITQTNAPTDLDSCDYFSDEGANQLKGSFAINVTEPTGGKDKAQSFSSSSSSDETVPGVGDMAFFEPGGFVNATLYVLEGDTFLNMNGGVGLEIDGLSEDLTKDQLAEIARIAVARL